MHNLPALALQSKSKHQPHCLPRQDVFRDRKMNVEQGGDDRYVIADVLHSQVQQLDADVTRHLGEVQPGNLHPLVPVFDEKVAAAGVTAEIVTEPRCQTVVPRGVHLDVLVEQGTDLKLAFRSHWAGSDVE